MANSNRAVAIAVDNDAAAENQSPEERRQAERMIEALLFASAEPLSADDLAARLPRGRRHRRPPSRSPGALRHARRQPRPGRRASGASAPPGDLSFLLSRHAVEQKRLSRAAMETLAIIAYHQPVTRAEIEEIRGVATSKGTLDLLLETGWIRMRGRRRAPGRPVTYGTTEAFLAHFGLDSVGDLPGVDELKGAGLLDSRVPAGFSIPEPHAGDELTEDEDPLEEDAFRAELAETDEVPE